MSARPARDEKQRGQIPFDAPQAARIERDLAPLLLRAAPFGVFIALLAMQPWLEGHVDARWLAVSRCLAAGALLILFWRAYCELRPPAGARPSLRESLLAVGAGLAVFVAWITFDSGWAAFETGPGLAPLRADGALDPALVAMKLVGLVLVVPVMEELFWRSLVMRWIDRRDFLAMDPRAASLAAVGVSAALFALEHSLWFAGLLAGVVYAWLYRRSGNLWTAILAHATTNGALAAWILATRRWELW